MLKIAFEPAQCLHDFCWSLRHLLHGLMVVPWYLGTTNTLASRWCHNLATRHPRLDKPKATVKSMSYLPMLCLTSFCSLMLCVYRAKDGQTRQKFSQIKVVIYFYFFALQIRYKIINQRNQRNLESKRIATHGTWRISISSVGLCSGKDPGAASGNISSCWTWSLEIVILLVWKWSDVGVGCGEKDNEKLHTYIIHIII